MAQANVDHPLPQQQQLKQKLLVNPATFSAPAKPADDGNQEGPTSPNSSQETLFANVKDTMGIGLDHSVTIRLRSITCQGVHDKTEVSLKLQGVTQWSKPTKNLGDHTCEIYEFQTSIHIMSFDNIKIDLYDVNILGQRTRIGRAYLPLRDMVKKVAHRIDSAVDKTVNGSSPTTSSSSSSTSLPSPTSPTSPSPYTVQLEDGKLRDIVQVDLPLFKHGSYSKFGVSEHSFHQLGSIFSNHPDDAKKPKEVLVSTGSKPGQKDVEKTVAPPQLVRLDSYAETVMNGVQVGMLTVEVGLNYNDLKRRNTYYSTRLRSKSVGAGSVHTGPSVESKSLGEGAGTKSRRSRKKRSNTNQTAITTSSSVAATDATVLQESYSQLQSGKKTPKPLDIATKDSNNDSTATPLDSPPSSEPDSPASPIQPCLSSFPSSSSSNDNAVLDRMFSAEPVSNFDEEDTEDEEDKSANITHHRFDDENQYLDGQSHLKDEYKGENLSKADREREEDMMAEIMANGDPVKKKMYLEGQDGKDRGQSKKFKFQLFSDETRSAFKDIQLLYSSFFGHGWNLTRGEFWKGIRLVEKYYEKNPMKTTNRFFDDIETLERARHFVRLAIATYGSLPWLYFGYSYKSTALNFVRLHSDRKNVIDYFKLNKEDMITWHFDRRSALVPSYYIIRDPHTNSLCVIIRGTFSITDAMTDLVCEYYPYKGGLVHKGIMDNARFVLQRSGRDIEAALRKFNLETLYCIGHSLGAGSASLLCSLLQDHFKDFIIPADKSSTGRAKRLEVKAYLFAPPPIATLDLARSWEKTQLSIVNENDIVSRLSYGNALDLKEMIKIGALESRNPAYKGLSHAEKEAKILEVLGRAREKLQAVNDIPRLVLPGKVAYLHKVYRSTPIVRSQDSTGSNKFGGGSGSGSGSGASISSASSVTDATATSSKNASASNPLAWPLNVIGAAFQAKNQPKGGGEGESAVSVPTIETPGGSSSNNNNQTLDDTSRVETSQETPLEAPPSLASGQTLGKPIKYTQTSDARAQATESILRQSHDGQRSSTAANNGSNSDSGDIPPSPSAEEVEEVLSTTKPKKSKHLKAQKEIRMEYSDRELFLAIPLRPNWAWHHFPQQYDSRVERALSWAKSQKAEYDKEQKQ
ncbi:hypothetical protein BGW41_002545 [Actinomortierella wolfii]|nr:hypothetical protein BGW41_002545 [Actinomortierella wolfii]